MFYDNTGFMTDDLAKHFNATVIFVEHRYFGASMPFGDKSYESIEYYRYLTTE